MSKAIGFKTPYEIKEGVKPSVKHLRIFGCKAYVHIPKEKRTKLDQQGIAAIFVGYSESSSEYEFYDLKEGKFFTNGSAIFDEACFPAEKMQDELEDLLVSEIDYQNDSGYEDDQENDYSEDESDEDKKKSTV
jgi:hypothetical protein